jgi:RNA polymerase sigma-70 factor, ECF subfamily
MPLLTEEARKRIEDLFHRYGAGLASYVLVRVGSPELAEEITARVFLTVVRHFHQQHGSLAGWLWSIVRTELSRHFRRPALETFPDDVVADVSSPGARLEQEEQAAELRDVLEKLPTEEQELVSLKFFLGLGNQEIADVTGLTPNHVGVKLHRALRALRVLLERSCFLEEPT